jgi:solute carrier family 25 S-adenosylmethionine transporter 26
VSRLSSLSAIAKPNPRAAGAFFTTYERTKTLLHSLNRTAGSPAGVVPTPLIHATASSLAELVSCAILTPAEVIKQNAQMVSHNSPTNATLATLAKFRQNPAALWRGYTALAGRNLPFTAMQFPLFERLRAAWKARRDAQGKTSGSLVESAGITALSAGSAGAVAAVLTTPVDVVKTRIMLAAGDSPEPKSKSTSTSSSSSSSAKPNAKSTPLVDALGSTKSSSAASKPLGSLGVARAIVQEQGLKGLWRGGALRGVWTFIGSGLYLGAYEGGRVYLASRRGESVDEGDLM